MLQDSSGRARRARRRIAAIAVSTAVAVVALAGLALASSPTLKTARNSGLNQKIVVDSKGMTVYELRPETVNKLLCKSKACFNAWPPLKVSKNAKLTKTSGVKGKLGKIHRSGFYQVTLGGVPLYHFAGDSKAGNTNGNGIKTFGGTWHVVKASSGVQYGGY